MDARGSVFRKPAIKDLVAEINSTSKKLKKLCVKIAATDPIKIEDIAKMKLEVKGLERDILDASTKYMMIQMCTFTASDVATFEIKGGPCDGTIFVHIKLAGEKPKPKPKPSIAPNNQVRKVYIV